MVVCCQVTKQLEQTESDKREQEQELEKKGRELFKTQVSHMSKNPSVALQALIPNRILVSDQPGSHHQDLGGGGEGAGEERPGACQEVNFPLKLVFLTLGSLNPT